MRMVLRVERMERSVRRREDGGWVLRVERENDGERKKERAVARWPVP